MRPALVGVLLLVGLRPGTEYAVTCNGQVQIAASDSLGIVEGEACADTVCYCVVTPLTSGVPESPAVDMVRLLWTWRHLWGMWSWV
jgi:hypothetical protein